jgi:hypothetical protein
MVSARAVSSLLSVAAAVIALNLAVGCSPNGELTSVADRRFDGAFSKALSRGVSFDLAALEPGPWTLVCIVGEDKASSMLPRFKARLGETQFDTVFDAGESFGLLGAGAVAFVYPDGVEVRPITGLAVSQDGRLSRCVPRAEAWLVNDKLGWRFRDGHVAAAAPDRTPETP